MKNVTGNIAIVILIIMLVVLPGCNGGTINPPIPPEPEIIADLFIPDSLHFESQAMVSTNMLQDRYQLALSGYMEKGTKEYGLVVSLFFLDKTAKAGTYKFVKSPQGVTEDYAVGAFYIGKDINKKEFYSDSGTVIISEINGLIINGSFSFYASNKDGTEQVKVESGILKIK